MLVFLHFLIYIKSDGIGVHPSGDDTVDTIKGTAAYEQYILGINLDQFLLRMFSSALRWHQHFAAFQQFKQSLLHTFAAYVTGDGWVIAFTRYLIDLVNVHNSFFSRRNIIIAGLQKPCQHAFHILSHIS